MKYLIVIAVIFAVIWFVRNNRQGDPPGKDAAGPRPTLDPPQDMVRCAVCSLHLPRSDALPAPDGRFYCCAEHRLRGEA